MTDEFERIRAIEARLGRMDWDVETGLGDDAAVLKAVEGSTVLSVDTSVEGVHFRREFASWKALGRRAMMAALSDLSAMAATPRAALVSLILPETFTDAELMELVEGIGEAADQTGAHVIGGNLSGGSEVSITITVVGTLVDRAPLRSDAKVGDVIYLGGPVGARALGLELLSRDLGGDKDPLVQDFVHRWRYPQPTLELGRRLRGVAHAAIDLSDGLLQDLGHVCRASGVGAVLHWNAVPLARGFTELCERLGIDAQKLAFTGGEDYELLFTSPASEAADALGTPIGEIVEGSGVTVLDENDRPLNIKAPGYRHFADQH